MKLTVSAIVAVSQNGIIGRDGDMPWRLSSDLRRFKALTLGKPVIMGRKTFQSIGKPLPGRPNYVITRSPYTHEGIEVFSSISAAVDAAKSWCLANECGEICIIGGGEIYRQAMAVTDKLHVTHVLADIEGDTSFPAIDDGEWRLVEKTEVPAGEKDSHATIFATYQRRSAMP